MDKHEPLRHDEVKPAADQNQVPQTRLDAPANNAPPPEPTPTARDWWIQNGPMMAIIFALLVFLFMKFDSDGLVAIAKAALGLSMVVFLHELGHFLAAKWCDVHVTAFSIGFGPAIPGCSFKWGETTYKLALFPLGGYVQMVGQVDGDESSDGNEDDPRSFRNKSVGQRMLIISAGVIMNVILAIVCFVVVFRGPGKDRLAGVVGAVDTGAPAFKHGLRGGWQITQIGDIKNPYFENLMKTVMAAYPGEEVRFVAKDPLTGKGEDLEIVPRNNKALGDQKNVIGLFPATSTELLPKRYANGEKSPAMPSSVASRANPVFEFGDRIVATTDPDHPENTKDLKELRDDPRFPNQGRRDFFDLQERLQKLAGKNILLRVQRGGPGEEEKTVVIGVPPAYYQTLGVRMQMGPITALRDGSPAAKAGVQITHKSEKTDRLLRGDLIQKVEVTEPDGLTKTIFDEKNLDPERLSFELKHWADRMETKKAPGPWQVILTVLQHNDVGESAQQFESKTRVLTWDNDWRYEHMVPSSQSSPQAIPELGLAYQIKSIVADVVPGKVKDNPLKPADAIREIQFFSKDSDSSDQKITLKEDDDQQWAQVAYWLQLIPGKKMVLKVWRNQKMEEVTVQPVADETWPTAELGLAFRTDVRRQKADSNLEAIELGLIDTWDSMRQVFQTLRGMVIGTISPFQIAGPITMARFAYKFAAMDFWEFIFFLGLISVNLAVINFLPIPVLDGGHMVFLLYEKIRGKPASEGIRIGATYAGLALILCLMVFVLYVDVSRLF